MGVLGIGLYFRLWPVHLFKWISDYDEGAYSLGGRLISQGYLPYRDFVLVHPPLYDLTLAGIYKVFGYDFFMGRYLSIVIFVSCVFLAFLIVRKLVNPTAGLISAALFVLFPALSSLWYRVVQEPLGILLLLLSIYFATDYIMNRTHEIRLLLSGLMLGLMLTVKLTFTPAVLAFVFALLSITVWGKPVSIRSMLKVLLIREMGLLAGGLLAGVLIVTGFFLITAPDEFFTQVIMSQFGYRIGGTFDSITARVSSIWLGTITDKINTYSLIVSLVFFLVLLLRRKKSRVELFFTAMLIVSIPVCSLFKPFGETRYFVSVYVIILLGIGSITSLMSRSSTGKHKHLTANDVVIPGLLLLTLLFATFGTTLLLRQYNFLGQGKRTYEWEAYEQTRMFFLENPPRKIYALNPIIPALFPEIPTTTQFDTFGLLQPLKIDPEVVVREQVNSGVDYIVVDAFGWFMALFHTDMAHTISYIGNTCYPAKEITPGGTQLLRVEIFSTYIR
jgi:hypothetical protein